MTTEIEELAARFIGSSQAIACPEVWYERARILCVTRKCGIWQFLCGADHDRGDRDDDHPIFVSLVDIVERDPSVAFLATLNERHIAWRSSVDDAWVPHDDLSLWWDSWPTEGPGV
jgi:hypothetical protein